MEQSDRLHAVDALRGFALGGILMVNIMAFSSVFYGREIADPVFFGFWDVGVRFIVSLLFETKFYLLFSFLFGYSVTLQMRSAERAGQSFVRRLTRRQIGLWLIGAAHAVLLFHGDILTTYAVLGLILMGLRARSDRSLLTVSAALVGLTVVLWAVLTLLIAWGGDGVDPIEQLHQANQAQLAYVGDWGAVISQHVRELPQMALLLALMQAPCAMAMFLLGLVAGRRLLLADLATWRDWQKTILRVGLSIGLPGGFIYGWAVVCGNTVTSAAAVAVDLLTAPFLAAAYGTGVLLLLQGPLGRRLIGLFAPAGRMALSCYLTQSLVCSMIFYGPGLGAIGRMSPGEAMAVGAGIYAVQLGVSRWWIARFAYGPVEWLLRALTIWGWPHWRRSH